MDYSGPIDRIIQREEVVSKVDDDDRVARDVAVAVVAFPVKDAVVVAFPVKDPPPVTSPSLSLSFLSAKTMTGMCHCRRWGPGDPFLCLCPYVLALPNFALLSLSFNQAKKIRKLKKCPQLVKRLVE